jgi:integrase
MVPLAERRQRMQQQRVMQMPRKSGRAERVVRHRKPDGTVVEYRYAAYNADEAAKPANLRTPDSFGALIDRYERSPLWRKFKPGTHKNKLACFRQLIGLMNVSLRDITRRVLLEQVEAIAEASGEGAALNFAKHMHALFAYAESREMIDVNPARKLGEGLAYGEFPAWTAEQYQQAIDHPIMPERLRRAIVLARWTAQRRADVVAMKWSSIVADKDGEWISLTQQKTDKKMMIPVAAALAAELKAWRADVKVVDRHGNPTGPILLTDAGAPWNPNNLSVQMSNWLEKIPGFDTHLNIHGLRKFALTDLAERGASIHVLQAFGGHETLQMVQHYTKTASQRRGADTVRQLLNAKG